MGYALAAVSVVVSVIAAGALLPVTRPMFMNNHYATISGALTASMIIIPLQTVIPEELAFRGVLQGALNRAWVFAVSPWGFVAVRVLAYCNVVGADAQQRRVQPRVRCRVWWHAGGVTVAVVATAAAGFVFSWLRRRSGSLIAPIALHWSCNGLGALAAALVWQLST
ncbi:CAAX protease self-immunity family protein [Mycobacterium xenopi 4042]|uniref:CAAX protease self-immunity family protein n=1 Tax=Mycobacterium xenopi 4042 TaxID=1299334 RepID=X8BGE6_MYCXE|nr:CAAX protease self-immunity family protein [Mycobacterium xenopi 4042]